MFSGCLSVVPHRKPMSKPLGDQWYKADGAGRQDFRTNDREIGVFIEKAAFRPVPAGIWLADAEVYYVWYCWLCR